MRMRLTSRASESSRAGISIVEVTIALAIATTVLSAASVAILSNFSAVRTADGLSSGALFLETVLEDLSAQAYDDLLAFHGNVIFDQENEEHARFSVTLSVFESEVGLLQIGAVLTDLGRDRELGRVVTFRSSR
jgi:hypothetical protein